MSPEDALVLSKEIIEAAKNSSDAESLEIGLWSVINDYSERFPEIGRASALHEVVSFMFNNNARHFTFFPELALMSYEAQGSVSKWYDASVIAEHMTGYQIELLMNQQGSEDELSNWFSLWTESVKNWCKISVNSESWPAWGTGILNRCVNFSTATPVSFQQDVREFWDSMIDCYGSFAPTEETIQTHFADLQEFAYIIGNDLDKSYHVKELLKMKVGLLNRLEVDDLVDRMNQLIEFVPNNITDEEIEIQMNYIKSSKDIAETCELTNKLVTRLRINGQLEKGIELLSAVVETNEDPEKTEELATSYLKLAIYLYESDKNEEAETLFKRIADIEPLKSDSISMHTIDQACQRYCTLLSEEGRFSESKEYAIKSNSLSELMGDPFLFVRSCFNIVADCNDLEQKDEALEWFMLGMKNLLGNWGVGPKGKVPPIYLNQLFEQSYNLAVAMGQDERWAMMIRHTFGHMDGFPGNTE